MGLDKNAGKLDQVAKSGEGYTTRKPVNGNVRYRYIKYELVSSTFLALIT